MSSAGIFLPIYSILSSLLGRAYTSYTTSLYALKTNYFHTYWSSRILPYLYLFLKAYKALFAITHHPFTHRPQRQIHRRYKQPISYHRTSTNKKKYPRPKARIFQYIATEGYAPKLSKRMFSAGTPRLSSIFTTDEAIIGGPHIK